MDNTGSVKESRVFTEETRLEKAIADLDAAVENLFQRAAPVLGQDSPEAPDVRKADAPGDQGSPIAEAFRTRAYEVDRIAQKIVRLTRRLEI